MMDERERDGMTGQDDAALPVAALPVDAVYETEEGGDLETAHHGAA